MAFAGSEEKQARFLAHLRDTGIVKEAAWRAGVSRNVYEWRRRVPGFAADWDRALDDWAEGQAQADDAKPSRALSRTGGPAAKRMQAAQDALFFRLLAESGKVMEAYGRAGLTRQVYDRRHVDAAFATGWREALERFRGKSSVVGTPTPALPRSSAGEGAGISPLPHLSGGGLGGGVDDCDPLPEPWQPLPGPQSIAYESPADILLYGGAAGGGKSELLLGLALTRHRRAILFRREFAQVKALEDRAAELVGHEGRYNAQRRTWRFADGRMLEFGAVQLPGDERKYQGRAHDLKAFDEITHFTEGQFRFLCGWNRSAEPGRRVRIVAAGNPPSGAEGDWVIRFWAPWLDKTHPNPAAPGELRWFATVAGKEIECADGAPVVVDGEAVTPRSRSFVPARVEDNPYLMAAGYKATLQALPEPLRSQLLRGDFGVAQVDDPMQAIPTSWVVAAQSRWGARAPGPMDVLGVDVARGGADRTVLVARHGAWFGPVSVFPGRDTPDGPAVAGLIAGMVADGASVQIDVIGVGAAVYDLVRLSGLRAVALNAASGSDGRDRSGQLGFLNRRAEWLWRLREALDPETGEGLALPPDRELLADLTAPRWKIGLRGIAIESKDEIRARIGRSPDKGDALVYAFAREAEPGLLAYYRELAAQAPEKPKVGPHWKWGPGGMVVIRDFERGY